MSDELELFGFAQSTFVRTVRMVCVEKAAECKLSPLEFRSESHQKLHPYLKMPAMRHGDVRLFETLAISVYVDESFPGPKLQPRSALGRALMLQWISVCCSYAYKDIVAAFFNDENDADSIIAGVRKHYKVFDDALRTKSHLAGEELSLADLFLTPMIAFADGQFPAENPILEYPSLSAWRTRMTSRDSFKLTAA